MNVQNDSQRRSRPSESTLRERMNRSMRKRKKELRAKLILLNSALALIVIMAVLVFKVVSLNRQDKKDNFSKEEVVQAGAVAKEDGSGKKSKEKADPMPSPTPKPTKKPNGKEQWLRKDLDPDKPMVALTFDDGPYTPVTKRILAALREYDGRATFFCVGERVPQYESIVKKAYKQGCQLASHTYAHAVLTKLSKAQINSQIKKTDQAMKKAVGCATTALRPPGGFVDDRVRGTVKVPLVCWNVDSEDWKSRNTQKVLERCRSISDGDIVLMHDLYPTTAAAVEKLVPRLTEDGFQLVTVDELFYYKNKKAKGGELYYSAN